MLTLQMLMEFTVCEIPVLYYYPFRKSVMHAFHIYNTCHGFIQRVGILWDFPTIEFPRFNTIKQQLNHFGF